MTRLEQVKDNAYMILNEMAFCFDRKDNQSKIIVVYNLKNMWQRSYFIIGKSQIQLQSSSMSETNKYKSLLIVERNKDDLRRGYTKWENTLKKK